MTRISELFGISTSLQPSPDWGKVVSQSQCPYLTRNCVKSRKSNASVLIGTCTVAAGRQRTPVAICPHRLLERRQIFADCFGLLTLHEPGNEYHLLPEVAIDGGNVDYFLVSVDTDGKVKDFVGIELQTLDTTGTWWPERQRFLRTVGLEASDEDVNCQDPRGINKKMTAKTILMQLHHKIETFESLGKHLVLVLQDYLLAYMEQEFAFQHLHRPSRLGDSMHLHAYALTEREDGALKLQFRARHSTDAMGVASALGRKGPALVELQNMLADLQSRISPGTLFSTDHFTSFTPATPPS